MRTSSQLLLNFLLNAVWQIALIAALASLGAWLLRHSTRSQHWLWVAALCLSLLVPVVTALRAMPVSAPVSVQQLDLTHSVLTEEASTFQSPPLGVSNWSFQLNPTLVLTLLLLYGAFLLYSSFRLLQAWFTTRRVRHSAVQLETDEAVEAIMRECAKRLNLNQIRATLCSSTTLPVPVTIGLFRPVIILPEALLRDGNTDLLTSAIGHEFIHVERHDYVLNFIYELLYLPVSFHPAAALLRRRIKQTRELCCDELVAERILNAQVYARSLVALASSAPPLRRLSVTTTVGIADADILEARIMSLLRKPNTHTRRRGLLFVASSLLLLVSCIVAAAFTVRFDIAADAVGPVNQDPATREKERKDEKMRVAFPGGEEEFTERMKNDPKFRAEVERRREVEIRVRALRQDALLSLARVSMDQAIQIATSQTPGKVLQCSLDGERWKEPGVLDKDGLVFYRVVLISNEDAANGGITHVWVNAIDGSVMKTEKEMLRRRKPE